MELRASHLEAAGPEGFGDLKALCHRLREDPNVARGRLPTKEQGNVDIAMKLAFMTSCSALDYSTDRLEKGHLRTQWKAEEPLSKFIEQLFEPEPHVILSFSEHLGHADFKSDLKATKLRKVLGIVITPTDDIQDHLKLDRKNMTLEVFHHVGFIKDHLRRTKDLSGDSTFVDALKLGALPRALLLEVLESIQSVLFPLSDKKSRKLLKSYVDSGAFDPEIQQFEFGSIKNKGEEKIPFYHLSRRLSDLHQELLDPTPRGWFERQLERHSGARYMMMATMVGVLFALILGFLSLVVSSYQTYIAYQAWKHPVSPEER